MREMQKFELFKLTNLNFSLLNHESGLIIVLQGGFQENIFSQSTNRQSKFV